MSYVWKSQLAALEEVDEVEAETESDNIKRRKKRQAAESPQISDIICDGSTDKSYEKGQFLGKGGFSKVHELVDMATGDVYAGKIVAKTLLRKSHQRDKMAQEISLHKTLSNRFIVKLHSSFEDDDFVYMVMEHCSRRSLFGLHSRRGAITEPEARYFFEQMLLGVKYLHGLKIIHRDLNLGNIFLTENMEIKLGDFGLATKVDYDGERKPTLGGTPKCIAPEVLQKKGHSYEVDIWSLGCILYTLLEGVKPFKSQTIKEEYAKIKNNDYYLSKRVGQRARDLIERLLQDDPTARPSIDDIQNDNFMTVGYTPSQLPKRCMTMPPIFTEDTPESREYNDHLALCKY